MTMHKRDCWVMASLCILYTRKMERCDAFFGEALYFCAPVDRIFDSYT